MTALNHLKSLATEAKRSKYPSLPDFALTIPDYTDRTANGLTKMIVDFLNLSGHQAERISTTGRFIDTRETYTDVVGFRKTIGTGKWIKGSGTKGSADISATIQGRSVKIEVKIGKDRLSEAQKAYSEAITRAGGTYIVARDFEGFYGDYLQLIKS